jgi:hypothetical protein
MLRADDWQWNSWAGGVAASMGDCNSTAGSLNNRGRPMNRDERLSSLGHMRSHNHNDTDTG